MVRRFLAELLAIVLAGIAFSLLYVLASLAVHGSVRW